MEDHDSLSSYFASIAEFPLLTADEEIDLARRARAGDSIARDRLVRGNLRLVIRVAKQYRPKALSLADIVAEGNVGLMLAVDRFDPERGFRFSTYAFWWIRQCIGKALKRSAHIVHVTEPQIGLAQKLKRQREKMIEALGREPSAFELRCELGLSAVEFATTRQAAATLRSSAFTVESGDREEGVAVIDEDAVDPCDAACEGDRLASLERWLDRLSPRDRAIVRLRFGFDGAEPLMLREIGVRLRVTRERVRQLLNRALGSTQSREQTALS